MNNLADKGKIIMSANNNEEVLVLPTYFNIPVSSPQKNEEFEVINGKPINLIGDIGLRTISLSSRLFHREHDLIVEGSIARPMVYIDFWNKYRIQKMPFRVVAGRPDGSPWFNIPFTIDSLEYEYDKNGDILYDLDLTEYNFPSGDTGGVPLGDEYL